MGELEDLQAGFFRTPEQKQEAWEESTVADVCKRIGMPEFQLKAARRALGPAFGCDWLNGEDILPFHVLTHREFRFNFEEIFKKGHNHPLTKAFLEKLAVTPASQALVLIVKVYEVGRVVLTNYDVPNPEFTSLTVRVGGVRINIIHQPQFFEHFEKTAEDYVYA